MPSNINATKKYKYLPNSFEAIMKIIADIFKIGNRIQVPSDLDNGIASKTSEYDKPGSSNIEITKRIKRK